MQTNYDKIQAIIEAGHIAQCKDGNGYYILYSSITYDGVIRRSGTSTSFQDCYHSLGITRDGEEEINSQEFTEITVYNKQLWYPKVGDMVQILPTVKDIPGYNNSGEGYKKMIGGPFEIHSIDSHYCFIYNKDKSDYFTYDYRVITPYIDPILPSQDEIIEAMETLQKAGKIKEGKVII